MAGKKASGPAGRFANRRKGKQSDFNLLAIVRRICGEPQPFQMEKNELGELEIIVYAFFLYIFVGNLFYMHFQSESLLLDTHKSALARDINGSKIHDKSVKDHSSARRGFEGAMFTGSAVDSIYHAVVTMTVRTFFMHTHFPDLAPDIVNYIDYFSVITPHTRIYLYDTDIFTYACIL